MSDPYQPQQNPPGQPTPYGQSYPPAVLEHPQGTVVLVLGIVGFFVTICAPIAWYMGSKALKEIRASGQTYSNEQYINVGRILGMVVTILALIGLVFGIIVVIIAFATAAANN